MEAAEARTVGGGGLVRSGAGAATRAAGWNPGGGDTVNLNNSHRRSDTSHTRVSGVPQKVRGGGQIACVLELPSSEMFAHRERESTQIQSLEEEAGGLTSREQGLHLVHQL
jgi:hypothetical protein